MRRSPFADSHGWLGSPRFQRRSIENDYDFDSDQRIARTSFVASFLRAGEIGGVGYLIN